MRSIIESIIGTLFLVSLTLNFLQLRGFEILPPVTQQEEVSRAKAIIASDIFSVTEKKGK